MRYRVQVKGELVPEKDPTAGGRFMWKFRLIDDHAIVVDESGPMWDSEDAARSAGEQAKRTRQQSEAD